MHGGCDLWFVDKWSRLLLWGSRNDAINVLKLIHIFISSAWSTRIIMHSEQYFRGGCASYWNRITTGPPALESVGRTPCSVCSRPIDPFYFSVDNCRDYVVKWELTRISLGWWRFLQWLSRDAGDKSKGKRNVHLIAFLRKSHHRNDQIWHAL